MDEYRDNTLCVTCQGKCCKTMGCHLSPDDIGEINYNSLKKILDTGDYSIDWWEGYILNEESVKGFFIRVRNIDGKIVDPSWGGRCILLTNNGCSLSFEKRPKGARYLIAKSFNKCESKYNKFDCATDWIKHYSILNKLYEEYR